MGKRTIPIEIKLYKAALFAEKLKVSGSEEAYAIEQASMVFGCTAMELIQAMSLIPFDKILLPGRYAKEKEEEE